MNANKYQYLRKYYELHGLSNSSLSCNEDKRIQETLKLIPHNWESVIDVGCGDGRVSRSLLFSGVEVIGMDWSESSLRNFQGTKVIVDIKEPWPLKKKVDGALCAEVLEHLSILDAKKVLANICRHVNKGFIISVPAREDLETHTVGCQKCGSSYHLWGHMQTFNSFEEVDMMVGRKSCQRAFVSYQGIHISPVLNRFRRKLGYYPYSETAICPFCSVSQNKPAKASFLNLLLLWSLAHIERLTNSIRPQTGWFICRYDK